jgi:TRAP-type transport system periplasmic protein
MRSVVAALLFASVVVPAPAFAKDVVIKIATLAPEGSTWWRVFKEGDKRLRELTNNRVQIRLYAGGVAGDEPDVVRKMRIGQLHGAAITSVGLAELQPAMLALQAPGMFQTWDELYHVRDVLRPDLEKLLADKGYVALMWGDVGFNRIFSAVPVKAPGDLKGTKPWCWTQDGVYQALYSEMGVTPVLLGVPDVLPGLQTGLIDAYPTPPLAAVSLQWFTRSKHMLDVPINVTIGAVVVTTKVMEQLSPEDRAAVAQVGKEIAPKLAEAVRSDNDKSLEAIKKAGITINTPDAAARKQWDEVLAKGAKAAAGKVYPEELLVKVQQAVTAYRAQKK